MKPLTLARSNNLSIQQDHLRLYQLVPRLLPRFNSSIEDLGLLETQLDVFGRLTDSSTVVRSGAIKDDLFAFGQRRALGLEGAQRNSPFQMDGFEFIVAVVSAHQERSPGCQFLVGLFRSIRSGRAMTHPPVHLCPA
jgi:hypothetical protein